MKLKDNFTLHIESVWSFKLASQFVSVVKLHCELLPEYMPTRWGWTEPKKNFDPTHIEQLVFENNRADNVWWKRIERPKATGSWMVRWGKEPKTYTHASIDLNIIESRLQSKLIAYLQQASMFTDADFSFLDGMNEFYRPMAMQSHISSFGGDRLYVTTHTLRHWLPDMPWAVVFGPAYVRLFGKDNLLSCPAYKVEELGPEMVFIQLTPNIDDIHQQFDVVMKARALAKQHLGEDCFFKPELAYDYRLSVMNPLSEEEIEAKRGKVFRVPTFELKPD